MIVDSSALVAVVRREPGVASLIEHLESGRALGVGGPTLVETGMVLDGRHGQVAITSLQRMIESFDIQVVAFGANHWDAAVGAFHRFGKGRHPAALNFGDCLSYAVAKVADEPLLCVGDDFTRTDLVVLQP